MEVTGLAEVANVLGLGVCNRLFSELKSLTHMIESVAFRQVRLAAQPRETPSRFLAAQISPLG
jgi:hypothetical protein